MSQRPQEKSGYPSRAVRLPHWGPSQVHLPSGRSMSYLQATLHEKSICEKFNETNGSTSMAFLTTWQCTVCLTGSKWSACDGWASGVTLVPCLAISIIYSTPLAYFAPPSPINSCLSYFPSIKITHSSCSSSLSCRDLPAYSGVRRGVAWLSGSYSISFRFSGYGPPFLEPTLEVRKSNITISCGS